MKLTIKIVLTLSLFTIFSCVHTKADSKYRTERIVVFKKGLFGGNKSYEAASFNLNIKNNGKYTLSINSKLIPGTVITEVINK